MYICTHTLYMSVSVLIRKGPVTLKPGLLTSWISSLLNTQVTFGSVSAIKTNVNVTSVLGGTIVRVVPYCGPEEVMEILLGGTRVRRKRRRGGGGGGNGWGGREGEGKTEKVRRWENAVIQFELKL